MRLVCEISEVRPYINWLYFFHAWSMNGKPDADKVALRAEADRTLDEWEGKYHTYAVFELYDANSDGDDLVLGDVRIPMLRQQKPITDGRPSLCLADFVRPLSSGIKDRVGVFATTVDAELETINADDVYLRMLSQVLADRLAEATAEWIHTQVRRRYWGYAPDEDLSMKDILAENYQGIRPAVGYPSLPDTGINFVLTRLIDFAGIGIRLTGSGMMQPHASVSGLMLAHPQSQYFDLGKIGHDQLVDYAHRRGISTDEAKRYLGSVLLK